jgi:hypothetical protein
VVQAVRREDGRMDNQVRYHRLCWCGITSGVRQAARRACTHGARSDCVSSTAQWEARTAQWDKRCIAHVTIEWLTSWPRVQIRQLAVESGLLNAADGSARWSQDNTAVLVSVNGPRQVAAYKVCPSPPPAPRSVRCACSVWCMRPRAVVTLGGLLLTGGVR